MYFVEIFVLPDILFSPKIKVATRKTTVYSTVIVHFWKFWWQSNSFCIDIYQIAWVWRCCYFADLLSYFKPYCIMSTALFWCAFTKRNIYQSHALDSLRNCLIVWPKWRSNCDDLIKNALLMLTANWIALLVTTMFAKFAKKVVKNGVQHATMIYPIPWCMWPRYIGSTLYKDSHYKVVMILTYLYLIFILSQSLNWWDCIFIFKQPLVISHGEYYRSRWPGDSRCQASSRDHFVHAPSQWEPTLQCNVGSHWLGTYTKWFLRYTDLIWMEYTMA